MASLSFSDDVDDDAMLMMMQSIEDAQQSGIQLTAEQELVLSLVREGKNVFFTGSGGTGKTFLLQRILRFLKAKYTDARSVVITAPTGIAAIPIEGSTIHSATGIGIPRKTQDFGRMWKKPNRQKWRRAEVWIIDEISMVSAEFLDYLEQTVRQIRDDKRPFGGLQVIFAGDFFQLQPVVERNQTATDQFMNRGLAFEAPAWHRANLEMVILKNVFRQEDYSFVKMLNGIRTGEDPAALEVIGRRCSRELPELDMIKPTILYSKNVDADEYNLKELNKLPDEVDDGQVIWIDPRYQRIRQQQMVLVAKDKITPDASELDDPDLYNMQYKRLQSAEFWKHCLAVEEITLKVGAQVMLLRNLDSDLVNGSRGVVVGWKSKEAKLKELSSETKNRNSDESQAMSAYKRLQTINSEFIPTVKFKNGRCIDCVPELFDYPIWDVGWCSRVQVPLKLAWAIVIHKCQGMTLDYVKVNLKDIFAEGQVYVALSRARSLESLQVIGNASRRCVKVCPRVVQFYKALSRNEVHSMKPLRFPDLDLAEFRMDSSDLDSVESRVDDPMEKIVEHRNCDEPFYKWNGEYFLDVVCFHCLKSGHPAWKCKLGPLLRINA